MFERARRGNLSNAIHEESLKIHAPRRARHSTNPRGCSSFAFSVSQTAYTVVLARGRGPTVPVAGSLRESHSFGS